MQLKTALFALFGILSCVAVEARAIYPRNTVSLASTGDQGSQMHFQKLTFLMGIALNSA